MEHLPTSFKLLHEVDTLLSETVVIYHIVLWHLWYQRNSIYKYLRQEQTRRHKRQYPTLPWKWTVVP